MSTTSAPAATSAARSAGLDPVETGAGGRRAARRCGRRSPRDVRAAGCRAWVHDAASTSVDCSCTASTRTSCAVATVEAHRRQRVRSTRGCSWRCAASGCRRRGPTRTGPGRDRRRRSRSHVRARRRRRVVSTSSPSTTTKAPLASPWSCSPTDWPGRPAEQPHLVGRRGEQAAAHPLVGVVGDVRPPQRLGARQPGDDVAEHVELEAPCCGGRQDGARRRCGGHADDSTVIPTNSSRIIEERVRVWYERPG